MQNVPRQGIVSIDENRQRGSKIFDKIHFSSYRLMNLITLPVHLKIHPKPQLYFEIQAKKTLYSVPTMHLTMHYECPTMRS